MLKTAPRKELNGIAPNAGLRTFGNARIASAHSAGWRPCSVLIAANISSPCQSKRVFSAAYLTKVICGEHEKLALAAAWKNGLKRPEIMAAVLAEVVGG